MATTWTVEAEPGVADSGSWTDETSPDFADSDKWCHWINPNASSKNSFLGVTEASEDYRVFPEDVTLEPEFVQNENRDPPRKRLDSQSPFYMGHVALHRT